MQAHPGGHSEPGRDSQTLNELHQGEGLTGVVPVVGAEEGDDLSVEGGVPQPHQAGGGEAGRAVRGEVGGGGGVSQGGEVGQEQEGETEGRQVSQETKYDRVAKVKYAENSINQSPDNSVKSSG